jgi:hypothetical protein
MTVHRAIFGILIAFILGNSAIAADAGTNPDSVQKLYGVCKSPNANIMFRCAAYIQGFSTMMNIVGQASSGSAFDPDKRNVLKAYGLCHQEAVPVADMIRAFLNWTERNPQEWNTSGEFGVLASLREAWPCT